MKKVPESDLVPQVSTGQEKGAWPQQVIESEVSHKPTAIAAAQVRKRGIVDVPEESHLSDRNYLLGSQNPQELQQGLAVYEMMT
ncbi:MAG: hypothetical protein WAW13_01750 [Minisyncoccia bacterium]